MKIMLYPFLEVLATFIETYVCYEFIDLFVVQKIEKKRAMALSLLLSAVIYVINTYDLFSLWTLVIAILFVSMTCVLFYKVSLFDAFSISIFYSCCVIFFDFFSMTVLGFLLEKRQFAGDVVREQSLNRYMFIGISKGMLITCYCVIRKGLIHWCKLKNVHFLYIAAIGYIGVLYFSKLTLNMIDAGIVMNWFLFLMVMVLIVFSLFVYMHYRRVSEERQIIEIHNRIIEEKYNELCEHVKSRDQLYHDMKNHIMILHNLVENRKFEKAKKYMESLLNVSTELIDSWTGNDVIDCILSLKKKSCKAKGIEMTIDADIIHASLANFEISTILSNLLDNAMEACQKNDSGNRLISVSIRQINELLVIKLVNPVNGKLIMKNGFPVSTKRDAKRHGFGLRSVEAAVKKVDGELAFAVDDRNFTVVITLFL